VQQIIEITNATQSKLKKGRKGILENGVVERKKSEKDSVCGRMHWSIKKKKKEGG